MEFDEVVVDMLAHLKKLGVLEGMARNSVPEDHNVAGIHSIRNCSPIIHGAALHLMSNANNHPKLKTLDGPTLHHNIIGLESRLSFKSVATNQALLAPLSTAFMYPALTALTPYLKCIRNKTVL